MQPRFTKGSLCQPVLTSSFDKIIGFPDKGNLVDLIYLEFNKAFDMGPHGKLLERLEKMRINRAWEWGEPGLAQDRGGIGMARGNQRMSWGAPGNSLSSEPGAKFAGAPEFPAGAGASVRSCRAALLREMAMLVRAQHPSPSQLSSPPGHISEPAPPNLRLQLWGS